MEKLIFAIFASISILVSFLYQGNTFVFLVFCFLFCALLCRSWSVKSFFMIFLSTLLFLGFWLKIIASQLFLAGILFEPVGYFDYSPASYDEVLLISSLGAMGFICATYLMADKLKRYGVGCYLFRSTHLQLSGRPYIAAWILLLGIGVIAVCLNANYGVYHRGSRVNDLLPSYIQDGIKWLLVMGLDLMALTLLNLAANCKGAKFSISICLVLFIDFLCNVSLLSRGFPVSGGAILFAIFIIYAYQGRLKLLKVFVLPMIAYSVFSITSVSAVNFLRLSIYEGITNQQNFNKILSTVGENTANGIIVPSINKQLNFLVGRWIGLEGVAAISSYPDKGWPLFMSALREVKNYGGASFYDATIVAQDTAYTNISEKNYYAITLPGLIGFTYYAGSYWVVFIATFLLGIFGVLVELIFFRVTTYPLVVAFTSFLLAYRYISFGYAPRDSHLLAISLLAVGIIAFMMKKFHTINLFTKTD